MATRVSWGAAEITSSLDMKAPQSAPPYSRLQRARAPPRRRKAGKSRLIQLLSHAMHSQNVNFFPALDCPRAGSTTGPGSIDESPQTYVHHQTQGQKYKEHGRTTVAHQRQGNAGHRHEANNHCHVNEHMETKYRRHAHHQKHSRAILCMLRVLDQP